MNKKNQKTLIRLGIFLGVALLSFAVYQKAKAPAKTIIEKLQKEGPVATYTPKVIPPAKTLFVPYTVQAPNANWKVHEESCEEAAILMYHYFFERSLAENLEANKTDLELRVLKEWQVKNWGKEPDLNLNQLGELAKGYWGYDYKIVKNIDEEAIKEQIAAGNPVMVPVMTHSLKNPHYNVNDSYHILLIKGYDEKGVITNDAGIKEGKNWHYTWDILWGAIAAQKVSPDRELLILSK